MTVKNPIGEIIPRRIVTATTTVITTRMTIGTARRGDDVLILYLTFFKNISFYIIYSDNGDRYTSHIPHNKIVVRGLAQHITEADVRLGLIALLRLLTHVYLQISSDLIQYGLKPLAIRLIRKKKTGNNRHWLVD